jgi:hypothetical protein
MREETKLVLIWLAVPAAVLIGILAVAMLGGGW